MEDKVKKQILIVSAANGAIRPQPPRELDAVRCQCHAGGLCLRLPLITSLYLSLLAHLMDNCPNEILGLVFKEACTDDGLTGRSLALVSKHIHHASRRYAFQSITLYGLHQLSAFASLLDKADLEDRGIRHLYLTDRRRVWMECLPGQDVGREQRPRERVTEDLHVNGGPSRQYSSSAILRIFEAVSPTLQTLTLLLFDRYHEPLLSDTVFFPNLRELTIHGSDIQHIPQCLSLRRLHVIQDPSFERSIAQSVSHLAPLLTHLRISRLLPGTTVPNTLAHELGCMLHPYNPVYSMFSPTLEHVLLHMLHQSFRGPDSKCPAVLVRSSLFPLGGQSPRGRGLSPN